MVMDGRLLLMTQMRQRDKLESRLDAPRPCFDITCQAALIHEADLPAVR